MKALGMIEIKGFSSSIETLDACLKAADVRLLNYEANFGSVTIKIEGDVGAVRSSVDSGIAVALKYNTLISSHVIAKPDSQVEGIISGEKYIGDKYPPVSHINRKTVEKVNSDKKNPVNNKYINNADDKESVKVEKGNQSRKSFSELIKESKQKIKEEKSEDEIIPAVSDVDEKIIDELEFAQDEKKEQNITEDIKTEPNIIESNEEPDINTEYKNVNSDFIDNSNKEVLINETEEDLNDKIEEEILEEKNEETTLTQKQESEDLSEDIKQKEDNIKDEKSDSSVIVPVEKRRDCNYICALCDDLECPDRRE